MQLLQHVHLPIWQSNTRSPHDTSEMIACLDRDKIPRFPWDYLNRLVLTDEPESDG